MKISYDVHKAHQWKVLNPGEPVHSPVHQGSML